MAAPVYTYTFSNGSTIDATQINQDFSDILNGVTDGTKDLSINKLTLAANIVLTTNATQNIGTSTVGLGNIYIGGTSSFTTAIAGAATASWTLTLPATAGTSGQFLQNTGSGSSKWASLVIPTVQIFTATGTQTGWLFTVSSWTGTIAVGDTYTNNSNTYTVQGAQTNGTGQTLFMSGTGATSGTTLTKSSSASGPSTITFSAKAATALYTTATGPSPIYLRVRVVGGGGGGGGSGTGSPANGTAGNNSWFGANLILANGGANGVAAGAGGVGGSVTISTITQLLAVTGNGGENPDATSTTLNAFGGDGGGSIFGGSGVGGSPGGAGSNASANSGAGGGGGGGAATSYAASGGGGAGGYAEAIISSPGASYPYIVGASAAGGTGSNGTSGSGAAGQIIIEEFYQ